MDRGEPVNSLGVVRNLEVDGFGVVGVRWVAEYIPAIIHWGDATCSAFWFCLICFSRFFGMFDSLRPQMAVVFCYIFPFGSHLGSLH